MLTCAVIVDTVVRYLYYVLLNRLCLLSLMLVFGVFYLLIFVGYAFFCLVVTLWFGFALLVELALCCFVAVVLCCCLFSGIILLAGIWCLVDAWFTCAFVFNAVKVGLIALCVCCYFIYVALWDLCGVCCVICGCFVCLRGIDITWWFEFL